MRKLLALLLAAGAVGLMLFLRRRSGRRDPTRQVQRMLDSCRDLLTSIEDAAGAPPRPKTG